MKHQKLILQDKFHTNSKLQTQKLPAILSNKAYLQQNIKNFNKIYGENILGRKIGVCSCNNNF